MSFLGGKNSRASFYRYKQRERSEGVLVQNNLEGPIEAVQPNQAVQPAEALCQIEDEVQIDYFEMEMKWERKALFCNQVLQSRSQI